jgi:hypothetical protein
MTQEHNPQPATTRHEPESINVAPARAAPIQANSKAGSTDKVLNLDFFFPNSEVQGAYPELNDAAAWQLISTILMITGADRGPWARLTPAAASFLQRFNKSELRLSRALLNNWHRSSDSEQEVEAALRALRSTPERWREWTILVEGKPEKVTIQWFYEQTEIVGIIKGPAEKTRLMKFHTNDLGEPWKRIKQLIKGYWELGR